MTVAQLLHGIVTAGVVAGALASIGLVIHWVLVRPLRNMLRNEIVGHLVSIKENLKEHTTSLGDLEERLAEHINNHEGVGHAMDEGATGRGRHGGRRGVRRGGDGL